MLILCKYSVKKHALDFIRNTNSFTRTHTHAYVIEIYLKATL